MIARKQNIESPMPSVDESWWESVLAEEGRRGVHAGPRPQSRAETRGDGKARDFNRVPPNWARVKELYSRDQIVSLRVTACNRGGLLVEGEDLSGFVPFSHLVDIS